MAKAMVITVGTGPTVAHGICFSIRNQNPEYIAFLLTKESKEKTMPIITKDKVMEGRNYSERILHDPNDVERIAKESQKVIKSLKYKSQDVAIDYTSGTKAMSAGLTIAGIKLKVGTLVYVSGDRNTRGTVISGTERPMPLEPNRIYADDLWIRAVELFNKFQYDTCIKIIGEAEPLLADEEFQQKLLTLELLAEAYSSWDKFELGKAFKNLNSLTNNESLTAWGVKSRVEENKAALYQEKDNVFCKERIADLLANAERRGVEKKFDDAVARLYRTIEYIAQYKINEKGYFKKDKKGKVQTDDLDIGSLPSLELQQKYQKYRDSKNNKIKLTLYSLYELLDDLGEEIGRTFKKEMDKKDSKLKKLLAMRNNSILAHGFGPVSESTYKEMLNTVKKFTKLGVSELDEYMDRVKFPIIKLSA